MESLYPITGISIGTAKAQIKQTEHDDLTLVKIAPQSTGAAVFTSNAFCAAPVTVARSHLQTHTPRYLLINTGNANAGTGERGIHDALACCEAVAQLTGCSVKEVLPFSTGVIGIPLPVDKIRTALPTALTSLEANGWEKAARAIMTTDTRPKSVSRRSEINGQTVTVTGIAKGAGMIRPNLATMLAFLATDAKVPTPKLQSCLQQAVDKSFNRITIDGDTSTNDACVLVATGQGSLTINHSDDSTYQHFCAIITDVCSYLAKSIVRDGEGATKFITISVEEGASEPECLDVAYTIAHSPLVKTAFFASDPNWGRILAAVGRAGVPNLAINEVQIYLDEVCIVRNGGVADTYTEAQGQRVMSKKDIGIRVLLGGRGHYQAEIYTCDFSYDYVKINAEYRT
jgi:glutamate N-acetyltransferase/amino-acid N-acetyltransferase